MNHETKILSSSAVKIELAPFLNLMVSEMDRRTPLGLCAPIVEELLREVTSTRQFGSDLDKLTWLSNLDPFYEALERLEET